MENYVPIGKLTEQPPPYATGAIAPLDRAAITRKHALALAYEILEGHTTEELILAAHYIATGELPAQEDDNDDD